MKDVKRIQSNIVMLLYLIKPTFRKKVYQYQGDILLLTVGVAARGRKFKVYKQPVIC